MFLDLDRNIFQKDVLLGFFTYFFPTETKTQYHFIMSRILRTLFVLTLLISGGTIATAQICTPDTQYTVVGLYPDSLAPGNIGVAYEQVVHVVIPQDTIVELPPFGMLTVDLCELTVDSIPNLPDGLMYECAGGSCTYTVDHTEGVINRFCVKISGTPTAAVLPDDSLIVYATVTPGAFNIGTGTCDALTITLPDSLTTIVYKTALVIRNSTSIGKELNALSLSVFPNPSLGEGASVSMTLPSSKQVMVNVRNVQGQVISTVDAGVLPTGLNTVTIPASQLPAGMYVVEVKAGDLRQTKTWILR